MLLEKEIAQKIVPDLISLKQIRGYARKSFRSMDAYRKDLQLESISDIVLFLLHFWTVIINLLYINM